MVYTLLFSLSSKCSLFLNSKVLGSSIIHILYTECAKIKKNNSGGKRLNDALSDPNDLYLYWKHPDVCETPVTYLQTDCSFCSWVFSCWRTDETACWCRKLSRLLPSLLLMPLPGLISHLNTPPALCRPAINNYVTLRVTKH